jgi:hypothetical protein
MIGVACGITMDVPGFERELVEMKYLTAGHQISANVSESLRTRRGRSRKRSLTKGSASFRET